VEARIKAAGDVGQGGEIKMPEQLDFRGGQLKTELTAGLGK
jgi:hypothetical protein